MHVRQLAGARTFLELLDTPATYTGQALKLAKVNAGETDLSLDLLLSFTDWYAGTLPTSYPWLFEADTPIDWGSVGVYFSPIHKNGIGQYVVYVAGGYEAAEKDFWRYNFATKQWQRMTDCPVSIVNCGLTMSPDETTVIVSGLNTNVLQIYDIATNTWTSSSAAPNNGTAVSIFGTVILADNDTVWCQVRNGAFAVKFYRYVISTDTWTQFANSTSPAVSNGQSMSVNTAETILYAGGVGATYYNIQKYVIATDTYSSLSLGAPQKRFLYASDKNARLWWFQEGTEVYYYYNCDTEAVSALIFETNAQATKFSQGGFFEMSRAVMHARSSNPTMMSYSGTGYWKLVEKVLTDYNLVVFEKPADGHSILAIDKASGFTIPIDLFSTLCLPAGTWEFFYAKDGDYTKLKISGSELK